MPEPHATAGGIVIGATIGISGSVLGAQLDALLVGLLAAIFVSVWMPAVDNRLKAAAAVAVSSLLAGYGSPVAASWLSSSHTGVIDGSPLRLLVAMGIGIVTPTLVPAAVSRMQDYVSTFGRGGV